MSERVGVPRAHCSARHEVNHDEDHEVNLPFHESFDDVCADPECPTQDGEVSDAEPDQVVSILDTRDGLVHISEEGDWEDESPLASRHASQASVLSAASAPAAPLSPSSRRKARSRTADEDQFADDADTRARGTSDPTCDARGRATSVGFAGEPKPLGTSSRTTSAASLAGGHARGTRIAMEIYLRSGTTPRNTPRNSPNILGAMGVTPRMSPNVQPLPVSGGPIEMELVGSPTSVPEAGRGPALPPPADAGAAMAIWLGLTMDGVPEAMVIGILANADSMSMALVVGVFLANFPEAIATASMMNKSGMHWTKNLMLWSALCVMTGAVAMLSAIAFPKQATNWLGFVTTSSEGMAAGAMLAMIAGTMLPDAYAKGGADLVGFWTVMGFLSVLCVRVVFPTLPETPGPHADSNHHGGD